MVKDDISLLTQVAESRDSSHHCRLHHDAEFASEQEVAHLVQIGIKPIVELDTTTLKKIGHYRPLCAELRQTNPHIPISIGCPHFTEVRSAMYRVLDTLYTTGVNASTCVYLLNRITAINDELASQDLAMAAARSAFDAEKKIELGTMHTTLVNELLAINREIVQMYRAVLSA